MSEPGVGREAVPVAARPLGLSDRQVALLAWSGAWVTGLLCLWLEPAPPFVRHHAVHAVALLGGLMALALGLWAACLLAAFVSPTLFRILAWATTVVWGVFLAGWIGGLATAALRHRVRLPWLTQRLDARFGPARG